MKRLLFIPFLLIGIVSAFAQSAVLQGGPWKPYRMPMYIGQGTGQPVIGDSGPAGGGPPGVGISELGITAQGTGTPPYAGQGSGPYGANVCGYDAPVTNPTGYHYFCLSPNAQGGGLIALGYGGGASPLPFNIILNGVTYPFPGGFATIAIGVTGITGGTNGYCLTVNGLVLGQTSCNVTSAITSLTGDVTGTGPGATATTLATVNSGPGSVGSSTAIPVLTTNGKGLVTAQTTAVVVAPAGTLTGTTLASNVVTSSLTSVGALASGSIASGFGTIATGNEISTTANMDAATGFYISATQVLSSTTLGTGVTASSLTSFGNAPTLVSPVLSGTPTGAGSIITINSTNCQLAASCSIAALITVGITSITGGTPNGLFYDAAGFFGNLATGNNGTLVTSSGGVPSISSTLPAAVQGNITTTGTVTSGTWESAFGGTITGTATLSGTLTLSGTDNFTGTFEVGGYAMAFPAAASNLGYQVGAIVNGDCLMASGTAGGFADAGITCGGGGSGSPGGANTTIQYNASSSFGGVSGVTSNGTVMTFGNGALLLAGSSSGAMTLEAPAIASTYVITFPAATDTVDVLGTAQTFTAAKTFTNSDLRLLGSSTGYTTFASLNASGTDYTLSFPAVTSTIAVIGLSQTFINTQTYSGTLNVSGTFQSGGNAFAFPAAPDTLAGLGTVQSFTATQTIAPTAATLDQALVVTQSGPASGTSAINQNYNLINITSDNYDLGSATNCCSSTAFQVNYTFGGANLQGARNGVQSALSISSDSSSDTAAFYTGMASQVTLTGALASGAGGTLVAFGGFVHATSTSSYGNVVLGAEMDELIDTGATNVTFRGGYVAGAGGNLQGSSVDAAYIVASSSTTSAWKNGLYLSNEQGQSPISSGGCVLCTDGSSDTITTGIDLSAYTISGNTLKFAGWSLSGGQVLTGGANNVAYAIGTETSGTYTPDCANGPVQYLFNGGAFNLAAIVNDGSCVIEVINASGSSSNPHGGTVTPVHFAKTAAGGTLDGATFSSALTQSAISVTFTNASPTVITWTNHGLANYAPVYFTASVMPTGITAYQVYYVCAIPTSSEIEISTTPGGACIAATSTGTTVVGNEPSVFDLSMVRISGSVRGAWSQVQ